MRSKPLQQRSAGGGAIGPGNRQPAESNRHPVEGRREPEPAGGEGRRQGLATPPEKENAGTEAPAFVMAPAVPVTSGSAVCRLPSGVRSVTVPAGGAERQAACPCWRWPC